METRVWRVGRSALDLHAGENLSIVRQTQQCVHEKENDDDW